MRTWDDYKKHAKAASLDYAKDVEEIEQLAAIAADFINDDTPNKEKLDAVEDLLHNYSYTANMMVEEDGSVTLELNEIDLVENGKDEAEARKKLAAAIMKYSKDFCNDFSYWSSAPNRKVHLPYVFKAIAIGDVQKIGESIKCQAG